MFLLDQDDGLYRLPSTKFNQMLRDPTSCRVTRFAGARVRMTDIAVELLNRQPICVVWNTFGFLAFDDAGYFDAGTFAQHQRARAEGDLTLPSKYRQSGNLESDWWMSGLGIFSSQSVTECGIQYRFEKIFSRPPFPACAFFPRGSCG